MIPKYLYQYTDIDSLEKIYKSKTILFKRLDLLNDPYEGLIKDNNGLEYECAKKNIYCSCWTSEKRESIAMWGIYKGFRGVRIKMNSKMFSRNLSLKETNDGYIPVGELEKPIETKHKNTINKMTIMIDKVYGPYSISYVPCVEETYDGVVIDADETRNSIPQNFNGVDIIELGNRKVDNWKYESEWRYKISPFSTMIGSPDVLSAPYIQDSEEFYLVPYNSDIVEILLAPCVEESTIRRLHILLQDKFDELVRNSEIKMRKM